MPRFAPVDPIVNDMTPLALDRLRAHPDNANRMSRSARAMLSRHLRRAGRCPPVVVRPHPHEPGAYELLDGHHRVEIARSLGWREIHAVIWTEVDDDEARLLLATLNRLHGEDDPHRRARLLAHLHARWGDAEALRALLPDQEALLKRLLRLAEPPPIPVLSPDHDPTHAALERDEPAAFVVFLPRSVKARLETFLKRIAPDPAEALARLVDHAAESSAFPIAPHPRTGSRP